MNENAKKLKKMATWTIAIFAAILAIVLAVLWIINFPISNSAFKLGWPILLLDLVLCAGVYVGYSSYLKNKK
jgi:cytochrome c oxidase assembly factor CtaG